MVRRYDVYYLLCPYCEQYQIVVDITNDEDVALDYHCTECEKDFGKWEVRGEPEWA